MVYYVAVDTPERTMQTNWLTAAGIHGIPYSFVIDKNGYISWIGVSVGSGMASLKQALDYTLSKDYQLSDLVKKDEAIRAKLKREKQEAMSLGNDGTKKDKTLLISSIRNAKKRIKGGEWGYVNSST